MNDVTNTTISCPFCSADVGRILEQKCYSVLGDNTSYQVLCCPCGAGGPISESKEGAIEQWNQRDQKIREALEDYMRVHRAASHFVHHKMTECVCKQCIGARAALRINTDV